MSDEEIPKIETQFCFCSHLPDVHLPLKKGFINIEEIKTSFSVEVGIEICS